MVAPVTHELLVRCPQGRCRDPLSREGNLSPASTSESCSFGSAALRAALSWAAAAAAMPAPRFCVSSAVERRGGPRILIPKWAGRTGPRVFLPWPGRLLFDGNNHGPACRG